MFVVFVTFDMLVHICNVRNGCNGCGGTLSMERASGSSCTTQKSKAIAANHCGGAEEEA